MNKDFLPFYNSLSQEEKDSFLEFSKEELIDHFIANLKNAECLLNRINKAINYIRSEYTITDDDVYLALYSSDGTLDKLEKILKGDE